jgi:NAD-dependent deacetylase
LPPKELHLAFDAAKECDLLFSIGTSGLVYPAAQIPDLAKQSGAKLARINPTASQQESAVDWNLLGPAGQLMPVVVATAFQ